MLSALAVTYALFAALMPARPGPAMCPFRIATGRRCPLCGLTRATHALTRGDMRAALKLHPLAPLLWTATAVSLCLWPRKPQNVNNTSGTTGRF